MQSSSIFTRQRMGLDDGVWFIMLICIVLSAGLFGYNVINHKEEKPCRAIDIIVNGRTITDQVFFNAGQPITFRSSISSVDHVSWDFGDGTKQEEGSAAVHVFSQEGRLTVTAMVNGKCGYYKKISIQKIAATITDTSGNTLENIIGKEQAMVGEKITFATTLPASSYEWSVENNRHYPVKTGKQVSYEFKSQASYTIVLMLDHDNKRKFRKLITVSSLSDPKMGDLKPEKLILPPIQLPPDSKEKETPKDTVKVVEPVKKVYKYVSDEILKTYIQSVVCKEMKPEQFDEFLCNGLNTTVIVNNKERKTFSQLCSEIQSKKIKIESTTGGRNAGENCINIITVSYDKKGFLGRNPCKN